MLSTAPGRPGERGAVRRADPRAEAAGPVQTRPSDHDSRRWWGSDTCRPRLWSTP